MRPRKEKLIKTLLNKKELFNRYSKKCSYKSLKIDLSDADLSDADLSDADLRSADLRSANLRSANLSYANLSDANLSDADLSDADLSDADLRSADLSDANLSDANLSDANLSDANLSDADLSDADLSDADLRSADLRSANLSDADLRSADLRSANLSDADLSDADLRSADLRSADLSDAKNMDKVNLKDHFEFTKEGMISYKAFGNTSYAIPEKWELIHNSHLYENVNSIVTNDCGCGINTGTKKWVFDNYPEANEYWKVLTPYEFLPFTVIPYNFEGKIRNSDIILLEKIEKE